jgi:hypothetical protein
MSTPPTLEYRPPPSADRWRYHLLRSLPPFLSGSVLGAAIWALSPWLVGNPEAWDVFVYYFPGLLAGGFIAALAGPRYFWAAPMGLWVGQTVYVTYGLTTGQIPGDPLWIAGIATGMIFSALVGGAGAATAFGAVWCWKKAFS